MTGKPASLEDIKAQLLDRLEELAESLLGPPAAKTLRKPEWQWDSTGGASLCVGGRRRGAFFHHAGGKGGGPLDLIMLAPATDFAGAVAFAKSWLGICPEGGAPLPEIDTTELQARAQKRREADEGEARSERKRISRAQGIWRSSVAVTGTLAERYLTKARCIPAPQAGWPHDSVRCEPKQRALVVAMTDEDGEVQAVQLIFLSDSGTKISDAEAASRSLVGKKQTIGLMAGCAVRLPGSSAGPLLLAEGPETGLSVWTTTGYATWVCLGGMAKAEPPRDRRVIACADDDPADHPAAVRLRQALDSWAEEGLDLALATPWAMPRGDKSDFNDVIKAAGPDAVRARIGEARRVGTITAPHYPRPRLSAARAAARLTAVMDGYFGRLERQLEARDWIRAEVDRLLPIVENDLAQRLKADLVKSGMSEDEAEASAWDRAEKAAPRAARERARRAAIRMYGRRAVGKPQRIQVAASAGLGKTDAVIKAILSRPALWHRNITVYTRDLHLAQDFADRFRDAAVGIVASSDGTLPRCLVIFGRSTAGMCCRGKVVKAALHLKCTSIYATVCHTPAAGNRAESYCHSWKKCRQDGYVSQFFDRAPAVRVMPHVRLGLQQPTEIALPPPDLVIVDESAVGALTASDMIDPSDLTGHSTYGCETGGELRIQEALDVAGAVTAAAKAEIGIVAALRLAGASSDDLRNAARVAALGAAKALPNVHAGMTDDTALGRMSGLRPHAGRLVAEMLHALARDLDAGRADSAAVERDANAVVTLPDGSRAPHPVFRLHQRKPALGARPGNALLLIDADADMEINSRLFGADLRGFTITAERRAHVTQVSDRAVAKSSLAPPERLRNNQGKAAALRERITALVKREVAGGTKRVLGISPKQVRLTLTGEAAGEIPVSVRWQGADFTHFGRHLGNDSWRDHDTVVVLSREQLPPVEAERIARCVWSDDVEGAPLALSGKYVEEARRHDLRHGSAPSVKVSVHADARVQHVAELFRECAIGQAIDRLRLIHRAPDRPARVVVLTNLPVPGLIVDRLMPLDDLLEGGSEIERALAQMKGGVLPLASEWLAANLPQLFPSPRTAQRATAALYKSPLGNRDSYCRMATYTVAGQRRPSKALVSLTAVEPREELARLLGLEVTQFRFSPDDGANSEPQPERKSAHDPMHTETAGTHPGPVPTPADVMRRDGTAPECTLSAELDRADDRKAPTGASPLSEIETLLRQARPLEAGHSVAATARRQETTPHCPEDMTKQGWMDAKRADRPSSATIPGAPSERLRRLGTRLEAVRPPRLWGDFTDPLRIAHWRERQAAARARSIDAEAVTVANPLTDAAA